MSDKKQSLIEILNTERSIQHYVEQSEGELTAEMESLIVANEKALANKIDGYVDFMDLIENKSAMFREKAKRFMEAAVTLDHRHAHLKDLLKYVAKSKGVHELSGVDYVIKFSPSAPRVIIDNDELVPGIFKTVVQNTTIDKKQIAEILKDGQQVDGAHLEWGTTMKTVVNKGTK